jgi:hypothetical protein
MVRNSARSLFPLLSAYSPSPAAGPITPFLGTHSSRAEAGVLDARCQIIGTKAGYQSQFCGALASFGSAYNARSRSVLADFMDGEEQMMDQVCFALPLVSGKTEAARAFMRELEGPRKGQFTASEQRINITKESWYLQQTPNGDLLVAYMESPDFAKALSLFGQSKDEFDLWFKQQMADVTGVDLNNPPQGPLSEQLSSYAV